MATWKGNVALLRRRTNWDDPASTRKTFSLNKHGHLFVTCLMILYRMAIFVGLMSSYGWQKKSVPHTQQGKGFVATIPIYFWICSKKLYIRIFTHEKLPDFVNFVTRSGDFAEDDSLDCIMSRANIKVFGNQSKNHGTHGTTTLPGSFKRNMSKSLYINQLWYKIKLWS